jgi:lysyl-tRNA synthetase class 2
MSSLEELKQTRRRKLELFKKAGMEAYPANVPRDFCLADAKARFKEYEKSGKEASLAGRVMAIRGQGAILFLVLDDGRATFQAVIKKDSLKAELFRLLTDAVDIGDIVSVTGAFFTTDRGEQSILVSSWTMAAKSLLPLPEKWHGLVDPDEKLRQRYLDFIMEPETRELFYKKAKFWRLTRAFMEKEGFLEVETPTLETTTGGAEARPFITHHNDYDMDVYLRISVGELWQKRLMAAGFNKTYEIGRVYRNEGSSPEHAQEFTNLEFYGSYMSFEDGIKFTERLMKEVIKETFGTLSFKLKGKTINLSKDWPRMDYAGTVEEKTGIDVLKASEKEMQNKLKELKVEFEGMNRGRLIDALWKYCRRQIIGPAWLVNHPKLISPLSKANPDNPDTTLRVQMLLAGAEMTNGFAELNDPMDQRSRFEVQKKLIEAGDKEAMMPDWGFVEMLEHAMPPAFGFAYGDRLFAVLAGKPLRETQLFPLTRPRK